MKKVHSQMREVEELENDLKKRIEANKLKEKVERSSKLLRIMIEMVRLLVGKMNLSADIIWKR